MGAKVVPAPGREIPNGTVLIRDGLIEAVGQDVPVPADARVWTAAGSPFMPASLTPWWFPPPPTPPPPLRPPSPTGALELTSPPLQFFGAPGVQTDPGAAGPGAAVSRIRPEERRVRHYTPQPKELEPLRDLGFTAGVMAPASGILRGTSALVLLTEENPNELVLKPDVFQHVSFETAPAADRLYPSSLMGIIAAVRQTFLDARHYAADWEDFRAVHARAHVRPSIRRWKPSSRCSRRRPPCCLNPAAP